MDKIGEPKSDFDQKWFILPLLYVYKTAIKSVDKKLCNRSRPALPPLRKTMKVPFILQETYFHKLDQAKTPFYNQKMFCLISLYSRTVKIHHTLLVVCLTLIFSILAK